MITSHPPANESSSSFAASCVIPHATGVYRVSTLEGFSPSSSWARAPTSSPGWAGGAVAVSVCGHAEGVMVEVASGGGEGKGGRRRVGEAWVPLSSPLPSEPQYGEGPPSSPVWVRGAVPSSGACAVCPGQRPGLGAWAIARSWTGSCSRGVWSEAGAVVTSRGSPNSSAGASSRCSPSSSNFFKSLNK